MNPPNPHESPDTGQSHERNDAFKNGQNASHQDSQLAERVKELNCLYGISNLFENQDVSLEWIMQRTVELIPAALLYPGFGFPDRTAG